MIKNLLEIIGKILEFIYDFLFDWSDDPYEEQEFIESEKAKHSLIRAENKSLETIKQEFELIEDTFGRKAADYIFGLRQEVNYLIKEHNLVPQNIIRVIIPPEKLEPGNINSKIFEETIEGIYSQYNMDVILKPGNINIISTESGKAFVEMELESYTVNEKLLSAV